MSECRDGRSKALNALIRTAEPAAAGQPDLAAAVVTVIKLAAEQGADPRPGRHLWPAADPGRGVAAHAVHGLPGACWAAWLVAGTARQ
jgi:hypothetical protein